MIRPGENPVVASMVAAMARGLKLLEQFLGRLPDRSEAAMPWASVQRFHGIPEGRIEPPEMRRQ
jgi:hypothetical protein